MDFKFSPIKNCQPRVELVNSSHTPNKSSSILSPKNQFKKVFISPSKFINTGSSSQIGKQMCESAKYNNQIQQHPQNHKAFKQTMISTNINFHNKVGSNLQNLQNQFFPNNPQKLIKNEYGSSENLSQFFTIKQKARNRDRKYSINDLTSSSHSQTPGQAQSTRRNTIHEALQTQTQIQISQKQYKKHVNFISNTNNNNNKNKNSNNENQNSKNNANINTNIHENVHAHENENENIHENENFQFIRDRKLSYQPNMTQVNMLKKQKSSGQLWLAPHYLPNNSRRQSDLFPNVRQKKQQKFSTTPMYSPKDISAIKRDFQKKPLQKQRQKQKKLRKFSDNNQASKFSVPSFLVKKSKKQYEEEISVSVLSSKETKSFIKEDTNFQSNNNNDFNGLPKKITLKNFKVIRQLGEGKFGKVFLVQEIHTKFLCAMKVFKKVQITTDKFIDQFIRQMKIQSYLNHPNIIKMYGYFDDASNIYVLIQLACDGTLFRFLQERQIQQPQITLSISTQQSLTKRLQNNFLTQKQVSIVMYQLCNAISYLHSQNIIHRDLKPQNIVIHQKIIKLCDFGWSVFKGSTMRNTFCGTPLYLCPQLIVGEDYDQKVDIWAIGIMFYEFLIGTNPFKIHVQEDLANIVYQNVSLNSSVDPFLKKIISGCLDKNPKNRYGIKQILNHQFFKQNCPQIMNKLSKSAGNKLNQIMI